MSESTLYAKLQQLVTEKCNQVTPTDTSNSLTNMIIEEHGYTLQTLMATEEHGQPYNKEHVYKLKTEKCNQVTPTDTSNSLTNMVTKEHGQPYKSELTTITNDKSELTSYNNNKYHSYN